MNLNILCFSVPDTDIIEPLCCKALQEFILNNHNMSFVSNLSCILAHIKYVNTFKMRNHI